MNKPTPTPKQDALSAISALPHDTSFEEISYRRYVIEAIREDMADIEAGRTWSHAEGMADKRMSCVPLAPPHTTRTAPG